MEHRIPLLDVRDLRVTFELPGRTVHAVNGADFQLFDGETLGIVGESGSGKSVAAQSIPRLINSPSVHSAGRILLRHDGRILDTLSQPRSGRIMRGVRANTVSVIFQEPMRSLHPMYTVGWQIGEGLRRAGGLSPQAARARTEELLGLVGIPDPARTAARFPHQLSGGMRQRVMIAIALAASPRLLIADEPTTALDVTIQAQILELIARLRRELAMAVILITHDLGVVAEAADRVIVMYLGQVVESGPVGTILSQPRHPYTQGLVATTPRLDSTPKSALPTLRGNIPELSAPPQGCPFLGRCLHARPICSSRPPMVKADGSEARCWIYTPEWGTA